MENKLMQQVLSIIVDDSRTTPDVIATMLGVTEQEVRACIDEMQEAGILVKYTAVVNTEKLNNQNVQALIEVKVSPQRNEGFEAIAQHIMAYDEVKSLYLMSGAFDLMLIIEGKTLKDVAMFVSDKLSTSANILSTATHFILKQYKSNGVLLDYENNKNRLVVTP